MTTPGGGQVPENPVGELADHLLATIVAHYEALNLDLPKRRLVTIGSVAVDEPLVAVMYGGTTVGTPGNELNRPMRADAPRTASFNVDLWRPTPTVREDGRAPGANAESAKARAVMNDSWYLIEAAMKADKLGIGVIASVAVNEPQGGMVGVNMALEMQIP